MSRSKIDKKIAQVTRQYKRALDEGREADARKLDARIRRLMTEKQLGDLK